MRQLQAVFDYYEDKSEEERSYSKGNNHFSSPGLWEAEAFVGELNVAPSNQH